VGWRKGLRSFTAFRLWKAFASFGFLPLRHKGKVKDQVKGKVKVVGAAHTRQGRRPCTLQGAEAP